MIQDRRVRNRYQERAETSSLHLSKSRAQLFAPRNTSKPTSIYSFAPFFLLASFSLSLKSLLKILPDGLFGMMSTNSTPPFNHLCLALCSSTCFWIFLTSMRSFSSRPIEDDFTTNAFGNSPAASSCTGMTAASATAWWAKRCASSSAGATWRP